MMAGWMRVGQRWTIMLGVTLAGTSALASNGTWNGTTDAAWTTAANWSSGAFPASNETATFANAGSGRTTLTGSPISLAKIVFTNATCAAYTLSGDFVFNTAANNGIMVAANVVSNQTFSGLLTFGGVGSVANTFQVFNDGAGLLTFANTLSSTVNNKTLNIGGTGRVVANGLIGYVAGTALLKNGSGTVTLAYTDSTYNGYTLINNPGVLAVAKLANGGATSSIGDSANAAANLRIAGTLRYIGVGAQSTDRLFQIGSGCTLDASGTTWGDTVTFGNAGTLGFTGNGAHTLTLTGANVGANTLACSIPNSTAATAVAKTGAGRWTLSGANTYSGATTISAGTLTLRHAKALGDTAGGAVVANNARLELDGGLTVAGEALTISGPGGTAFFNGALNSKTGNNTWAGNVTVGAAGARIGAQTNATLTVSGAIDSGGNAYGLIVRPNDMTATVVLSGASTYVGATTVFGGTLKLSGGDDRLPVGTTLQLGYAGVPGAVDLNGCSQTVAGLQSTAGDPAWIMNNSAAADALLTIVGAGQTYAGTIRDGALRKVSVTLNGGTQTLNATNAYTGATAINAGTLALGPAGTLPTASPVTLAAGATLDVSARAAYTWGAGATLTASGTGTAVSTNAATIKGGATVDLGLRPITLNIAPTNFTGDAAHPALYVAQGALTLNGTLTVSNNGTAPLGVGTYALIEQAGGTITGSPTLKRKVGGQGLASGTGASLQLSGPSLNLVVYPVTPTATTLARHAGTGAATTYGDSLSFDVSVTPSEATGSVTLEEGGTILGAGTLAGGTCTLTLAPAALTAGSHDRIVAVYEGDALYGPSKSDTLVPSQTVAAKELTVLDATGDNRLFDGTTAATFSGTLSGVVDGDDVKLLGTGQFDNAGPGAAIAITATATLGGAAAGNYALKQPTELAADISTTAVWTATTGDFLWNTRSNWLSRVIGSGNGQTADFSTLDLATHTTVHLNAAQTIGNLVFGDTDTNSAAGWTVDNNGTAANTLTLAGATPTITVNALGADNRATIGAVVVGSDGLTKAGPGTLALTGANSYGGGTVLGAGAGRLIASVSTNRNALGSGAVAIGAGASVQLAHAGTAGNTTLGNAFTGAGELRLDFAAGVTPRGTYMTNLTAFAGTIHLAAAGPTGDKWSVGGVQAPGATLRIDDGSQLFLSGSAATFGSIVTTGNGNVEGRGALRITGATAVLNGDITLAGHTSFGLEAIGARVAGNIASGAAGTQTLTVGTANSAGSGTLSGVIGGGVGTLALTKASGGTLTLSGTNTYAGVTTVNAGVLTIRNGRALGAATAGTTVANNARVELDGGVTVADEPITIVGPGGVGYYYGALNCKTGTATWAGNVTIGDPLTRIGALAHATLIVSGVIDSGANNYGLLVRPYDASATVVLTGANTYKGPTQVFGGTLRLAGDDNRLPVGVPLQLGTANVSGMVDLNGCNQEVAGLTVTQTVAPYANEIKNSAVATAVLTVNNATSDTYSGKLTGNLGLRKSGAGSLTLSGANTCTGGTTVVAGTLTLAARGALPPGGVSLGGGTLQAGTYVNTAGALGLAGNSAIVCDTGAALAFADSTGQDWGAARLTVTGPGFGESGPSPLRFGTSATALRSAQVAAITVEGKTATLNADGYINIATRPPGTVLIIR